jgi:hypothetical protein
MSLNKSFWISLIFIFFVFVVAIVLLNLLNALAISDTQKIIEDGEIADLSMKVQVLHKYEKFVAKDKTFFSKLIHKTMKVFDESTTGKVLIDTVEGRIKLEKDCGCRRKLSISWIVTLSRTFKISSIDVGRTRRRK